MRVRTQVAQPIIYDGIRLDAGHRLDLLVEEQIVVEIKAVEALAPVHKAQVISYLRLGNYPIGLLINFHVLHLKDGLARVFPPPLSIPQGS